MTAADVSIATPRRVGKSALAVTPLGFGAGPLGDPRVPANDCNAAVAAAWRGGVRLFDTAPEYGIGRSERRLGVALAECGDRGDYAVNTKVGRTLEPEPVRIEANKTLSADGAVRTPRDPRSGHRVHFAYDRAAFELQHRDSLLRLGLPYVDSLTIHDVDYGYHDDAQIDAALAQLSRRGGGGAAALEEWRDGGVIKAIGLGCNREMRNYATWAGGRHEDLVERIADTVDLDFLVVAGPYTLLDTCALDRVLPLCASRHIGAIIASPFAGGWLIAPERAGYMYGETPEAVRAKTDGIARLCRDHGVPIGAVALQFVLAHPVVAAAIPGARSADEAVEAQRLAHIDVPRELWAQLKRNGLLDERAPTPGE
ncbi:MAG TPA: aldo/keto reductase [Pseudomonadales bacterium]|nr:aldo/keto reductase [Pseudomonadales bacterium]